MDGEANPIVGRKRLGNQLRKLREDRDLMISDIAERTEFSESKVSRMETGKNNSRLKDVEKILGVYEVDEAVHRLVMEMARASRKPGWWHSFGDAVPDWFETYVSLESEASVIREYEMRTVPGLMQTAEYARTVLHVGPAPAPEDEIEQQVKLRLARQKRLTGPNPPQYWLVLDEAVLQRVIGGPEVMHQQLTQLAVFAELPHVTLQILPFNAGAHMGLAGAFLIWEFESLEEPKVATVDNLTSGIYLERRKEVSPYSLAFDHLRAKALDPDRTIPMIRQVASKLGNEP